MKKNFWDFDENKNYISINVYNKKYKVINKFNNPLYAALLLDDIHNYITLISLYFLENLYNYSDKDQILIKCFLDIHPNNYLLSEMQLNTVFDGLNKPRNIYLSNKESIGKDKKFRAQYRHIFITLRDKFGIFNSNDEIMKLVIHELSHTMCNHITWRDDDHGSDFKHAENLIKKAYFNIIKN
tara:strand:+ start:4248 stop:4796 length:549 start_codon:yes stop_codon:yes gene_type:complete